MKGLTQFYEKINFEFLNISEKCVLNKKKLDNRNQEKIQKLYQ